MHIPTQLGVTVEEYMAPLGAGHYHVIGNTTNELAYVVRLQDAHNIVKAVNSFEAMRAALLGVIHHNQSVKSTYQLPESLLHQITQALALAEGKG